MSRTPAMPKDLPRLPVVVLSHVFAHLEDVHVAVLRLVCKEWKAEVERVMTHPSKIAKWPRRRDSLKMRRLMRHVGAPRLVVLFQPPPENIVNRTGDICRHYFVGVDLPVLPSLWPDLIDFGVKSKKPRPKPKFKPTEAKTKMEKAQQRAQQRALKQQFRRKQR